jgi:tetratricopeptide (TPR) repeat protein
MKSKLFLVAVALWLPVMVLARSPFYYEGNEKIDKGNYQGALNDFNHAIALDPKDPLLFITRALCKNKLNDWEGAKTDADTAVCIAQENKDTLLTQYRETRDTIVATCEQEIKKQKEATSSYTYFANTGARKFLNNDFYGCIADSSQAIATDPTHPVVFIMRARCKGKLNDWNGAMADANAAIAMAEKQKDAQLLQYKGIHDALVVDKTNYFNALERQRQEAAQKAIQQAQYDEDAAYEREKADVIRRMSREARDNEAGSNAQSQPSFWDRNAATLGNNLKEMQEGDARRSIMPSNFHTTFHPVLFPKKLQFL